MATATFILVEFNSFKKEYKLFLLENQACWITSIYFWLYLFNYLI